MSSRIRSDGSTVDKSKIKSDDGTVDISSLFEMAIGVFYLSMHRYATDDFDKKKNDYHHKLWEFVLKVKKKYM